MFIVLDKHMTLFGQLASDVFIMTLYQNFQFLLKHIGEGGETIKISCHWFCVSSFSVLVLLCYHLFLDLLKAEKLELGSL